MPPWARTISRTMVSPRPLPARVDVSSAGNPGALVDDREDGPTTGGADLDRDVAGAVAQRVVDEVRQRSVEACGVASNLDRSWRGHADGTVAGGGVEPVGDAGGQVHEIDGTGLDRQGPLLGACAFEQVVGQCDQPPHLVVDGVQRLGQLLGRSRLRQCQLDLGEHQGQRCAQLVAGLGHEPPLPLQPVVEPLEHGVEGDRQPSQLVVGRGKREPLPSTARGDRGRAGAHPLDRAQSRPRDEVAEPAREDERERSGDQQLVAQRCESLVHVLPRRADHEDSRRSVGRTSSTNCSRSRSRCPVGCGVVVEHGHGAVAASLARSPRSSRPVEDPSRGSATSLEDARTSPCAVSTWAWTSPPRAWTASNRRGPGTASSRSASAVTVSRSRSLESSTHPHVDEDAEADERDGGRGQERQRDPSPQRPSSRVPTGHGVSSVSR